MAKKSTKIFRKILLPFDYTFFAFFFLLCLVGLLFAIPWILKQRKIWNDSCRGSRKALILRGLNMAKLMKVGYELLLPYRNPNMKWIGFLDPTNSLKTKIKIRDDLYLITWQTPRIITFIFFNRLIGMIDLSYVS